MNPISLHVTFRDGRPFVAYIDLARWPGDTIDRTHEIMPDLLVDFTVDGRPVGIEILTPGAVSLDDVLGLLDRLGVRRPAEAELAPLYGC